MNNKKLIDMFSKSIEALIKQAEILDEETLIKYSETELKIPYLMKEWALSSPHKVYRVRLKKNMGKDEDMSSPRTFSYPPKGISKLGRLNLTGQSVFYSSTNPATALDEMKEDLNEENVVYISTWEIKEGAKIRFFPISKTIGVDDFSEGNWNLKSTGNEELDKTINQLSGILLIKNDGNNSNIYLPTAILASKIFKKKTDEITLRNGDKLNIHHNAIIYPSVQQKHNSELNIAFAPEFIDQNAKCVSVIEAKIKSKKGSNEVIAEITRCGTIESEKIAWSEIFIDEIQIHTVKVYSTKGYVYNTNLPIKYHVLNYQNQNISISDYIFDTYGEAITMIIQNNNTNNTYRFSDGIRSDFSEQRKSKNHIIFFSNNKPKIKITNTIQEIFCIECYVSYKISLIDTT